jgi:hypothetical protein
MGVVIAVEGAGLGMLSFKTISLETRMEVFDILSSKVLFCVCDVNQTNSKSVLIR